MKCPKCGQEILDEKEYCVNCGTKLKSEKKVPKRNVFIGLIIMVLLGALVCYLIINFNTSGELSPYINTI